MKPTVNTKHRIFQVLFATVILITAVFAVPSTNAKYATTKNYTLTIETKKSFLLEWTTDTNAKTITLPYVGKYLIIAKGGDGADGCDNNGSTYTVNYNGGEGGYVWAVYTAATANERLYACPGAAGERQGKAQRAPGDGGTNTGAGGFSGGNGDYFNAFITQFGTTDTASGGGGAATVVYKYNGNTAKGTQLLIAGGGGAAGSRNKGYDFTEEAGLGGNGGSMSSSSTSVSNVGTVYHGANGTTPISNNNNLTYGRGAKDSVGDGGTAAQTSILLFIRIGKSTGSAGTTAGVGGNAADFGGGGGGGYRGGGGGAGTSCNYSSGGGGGGSSLVSNNSSLSAVTGDYLTTANNIKNNLSIGGTTITVPTQYPEDTSLSVNKSNNPGYGQYGHGYVIVYYLGPAA
jgi:hypothetical protein